MFGAEPIGVAGSGRLAQALARALGERGEPVAFVASRSESHARAAAEFIGRGVEPVEYRELARRASRLLIAVSDSGLRPVVEILSTAARPGGIVLHTCGSRDVEDLAPLQAIGFSCGTLHPLQTITDPQQGTTALEGATFAISGDGRALDWARAITERLGGYGVEVLPGKRPLYHAAAVMASNYAVALIDAAQELMAMSANVSGESAVRMLASITRTAVEGALERGPAAALTGPIERGDADTVALHLSALASVPDRIKRLYVAGGFQALELARRKGLNPDAADELARLLKSEIQ